jgi:hypothetical protein
MGYLKKIKSSECSDILADFVGWFEVVVSGGGVYFCRLMLLLMDLFRHQKMIVLSLHLSPSTAIDTRGS